MLWLYYILCNPNFPKYAILDVGFGQPQNSELTLLCSFLCNVYNRSYILSSATWRALGGNHCSISGVQMSGVPCVVHHRKERPYKAILTLNQGLPLAAKCCAPYWLVRKKPKYWVFCVPKNTEILWQKVFMNLLLLIALGIKELN